MNRTWISTFLLFVSLLVPAHAFAQHRSTNAPDRSSEELRARFREFQLAIPKFRDATDQFRWALSLQGKLEKPLQEIESQSDVMLRYLSVAKVTHPRPDTSEFKTYSKAELEWETLNSAERIGAFLDFAVQAERQTTVSPKTMEFLYTLSGELMRLKWLTSHVK
jgi:hypothetical protein